MKEVQQNRMHEDKGFIAALDQSGGSTPKALAAYGITAEMYHSDEEMFDAIHKMRTRIIKSPAFTSEHILGAILFEKTMDRKIDALFTADYLWEKKGILPFLKVDKGLTNLNDGVQLMKEIIDLDELLERAQQRHIFGTKMRSVIKEANPAGIAAIVEQQFTIGKRIMQKGLLPILEPEVDIHMQDKKQAELLLKDELLKQLKTLGSHDRLMFKLTIPDIDDFYEELMQDPHVVRVAALSGGYTQDEANERLARNHGLIASFSRALVQGLTIQQSEEEFNQMLQNSILSVYRSSIT